MSVDVIFGVWTGSRIAGAVRIHETRILAPRERDRITRERLDRDAEADPGNPFSVTRCGDVWDVLIGDPVDDEQALGRDRCPACKAAAAQDAAEQRCVRCQHWSGFHEDGTGDVCGDCRDLGGPCWGARPWPRARRHSGGARVSQTACQLLRHDVRPRWIGDLQAAFCHTCGCLWIPEPAPGLARRSDRSGRPPVPACR